MAVERLTDYTRRIWTALDADAPEGHDFQVNDVIYYMDSSQCGIVTYVYPEGSIDVEFLPDVGGGGAIPMRQLTVINPKTTGGALYGAYATPTSNATTTIQVPRNTTITAYFPVCVHGAAVGGTPLLGFAVASSYPTPAIDTAASSGILRTGTTTMSGITAKWLILMPTEGSDPITVTLA